MHELSVIHPIVQMADRLAKENNVEQITAVQLVVGELHDMDEKWANHYYQRFCKGTALEGSELRIKRVPLVFKCKACGHEQSYTHFSFAGIELKCDSCGATDMDVISGKEFEIESIEFVDPEKVKDAKN